MENKYGHLTVEQLKEAIANAEGLVAEQEAEIAGYVKEMGKKKNTLADIKRINGFITYHFERVAEYTGWVNDYKEALNRAEKVEAGHETIVEFLEHMYQKDVEWHEELKADYNEKGYKHYIEMVRRNEITKTVLELAKMPTQVAQQLFKKDLEARYNKLVATVTKKVGKVLSIEVKRNWNEGFDGVVTGENGKCQLTTILAGGYNIQRLHYRTLCK